MPTTFRLAASLLLLSMPAPISAEDDVPYWASIRVSEVNMRVGPAMTYPIQWVYKREQLPLRVVRRREGWRLVEDPDGAKGWILGRFLSRDRTAMVTGKAPAEMRDRTGPSSRLLWRVEPGVVGSLGDCSDGWCEFAVGSRKGVMAQNRLWGVGKP